MDILQKKQALLAALDKIEKFDSSPRLRKFAAKPFRYGFGILAGKIIARSLPNGFEAQAPTFWGGSMSVRLPAGLDVFLAGGKTHSSETRLARFLIKNLREHDDFLDIGAHFGFFSLLAAHLAPLGRTLAIEAAPTAFGILKKNLAAAPNAKPLHVAVSDRRETVDFFEFPILFSEYNSLEKSQYEGHSWFRSSKMKTVKLQAERADAILESEKLKPKIIKIDVEGAEDKAVEGLCGYLEKSEATVAMEFVHASRGNEAHRKAERRLVEMGFRGRLIGRSGDLEPLGEPMSAHLERIGLESDNVVFQKS